MKTSACWWFGWLDLGADPRDVADALATLRHR